MPHKRVAYTKRIHLSTQCTRTIILLRVFYPTHYFKTNSQPMTHFCADCGTDRGLPVLTSSLPTVPLRSNIVPW